MLHQETVNKEMWELLQRLMKDEHLKDFALVGGTALSLKIGHRLSIDIDLFTTKDFDSSKMSEYLRVNYGAVVYRCPNNAVLSHIDKIKVDMIAHKYPLCRPLEIQEGVRLVSLEDIGAMKLHAIIQSGKRLKDFIDMYFLLEQTPLKTYLDAYEKKYQGYSKIAGLALLHFDNIDWAQKIQLIKEKETSWGKMKLRLEKALFDPTRQFGIKPKQEPVPGPIKNAEKG
ncbi:nucleotidyl transferase AbiEii/AbiGii toxin family protein [Niabella sp. W65]|nr:nucleotidyl transferase AbiEii/AbiGii toxin family protein [Niabella sp. W65]MCH7364876.1 nucleotidyl transferase AbiEii/AbiGii toxin family protein [Niabella sp. W65]ULT40709.1 nucleotidyl transferase AbiEii/AbiGii toxin family protein [Niabella sp. I65]